MYQDVTSKQLSSSYYMDLIDQMDEQNRIHFASLLFIGITNTTYAPLFTHMRTNTNACILSDRETVCKGKYEKLEVKVMELVYSLSIWSPFNFQKKKCFHRNAHPTSVFEFATREIGFENIFTVLSR